MNACRIRKWKQKNLWFSTSEDCKRRCEKKPRVFFPCHIHSGLCSGLEGNHRRSETLCEKGDYTKGTLWSLVSCCDCRVNCWPIVDKNPRHCRNILSICLVNTRVWKPPPGTNPPLLLCWHSCQHQHADDCREKSTHFRLTFRSSATVCGVENTPPPLLQWWAGGLRALKENRTLGETIIECFLSCAESTYHPPISTYLLPICNLQEVEGDHGRRGRGLKVRKKRKGNEIQVLQKQKLDSYLGQEDQQGS